MGIEGAHRSELVGEAALRHGSRFVKRKVREHPAKAVQRAESKYVKATADYHFRMAAQEHPEMSGNPVSRMWRKHRSVSYTHLDVYKRQVHPTQKPVALCEYFIKTYTRPGEVVADICAGSATTAVAALNTGRRFICFETVPAYYAAATERIRLARSALEAGEKGV